MIGSVSVIDGDALEIHGTRIHLWGIDAPESTQLGRGDDSEQYRCGAKATNDFDTIIAVRRFCAFDILVEGGDDLRKLPLQADYVVLAASMVRVSPSWLFG